MMQAFLDRLQAGCAWRRRQVAAMDVGLRVYFPHEPTTMVRAWLMWEISEAERIIACGGVV